MGNELVSVIIPTRNRADYLKQAIDSVYAQSYPHFEIIVVDDGGNDNTGTALKAYDARLHYVFQKQKGASAARNHGIRKAQGTYIAFLDDDDIYAPNKLQACVDYLSQHPDVIWLCSGFSFIDAASNPLPRAAIMPEKEHLTLHDIAMFSFIHTSSVIVRREALQTVGGFPEGVKISEDYHTWAKLLKTGKGAALPKELSLYRLHEGNTKLPWWRILRENMRIIHFIMQSNAAELMPREHYVQNLLRIIDDNLIYKKQRFQRMCFQVWCKIYRLIA